jgi:feruloyl esterase
MRCFLLATLLALATPTLARADLAPAMSCAEITGASITAGDFPAHCIISGIIGQRIGAGGVMFGARFELRLPNDWNGRFYFQGGGGTDGAVLPAYGDRSVPVGTMPALARGYAVVTTDGGHEDNDSSFGLDPQARIEWGYGAIDEVTRAAKQIVTTYYGKPPAFSYFVGCSNGGRQGMMMSQRFPEYYDGIVAGDPVFRLSRSHIASAWDMRIFTAIAPPDADGKPILARAFSNADLGLLSQDILKVCDAADGLRDGLIADPIHCVYDPNRLACTGAKTDSCLSVPQVAALQSYVTGPRDSAGRPLYATWPWDSGFGSANWRAWKLGTSTNSVPNAIKAGLSNNAIRYLMLTPPDPGFNELDFDFDRDPQRMAPAAAFADAVSTDLTAFLARGGRLIFYHGASDPAISVNDTIHYYENLTAASGGHEETEKFARLFVVPGMTHCSGGSGLDSFDVLSALVAWVEHDRPPDRVIATGTLFPGRSRPLCPYPTHAQYDGSGNPEDAASFLCRP